MKTWTKRILFTLLILIVLLLGAAILVPILFKDKIEAMVKEEVNKNLNATVDWGDWDITLFKSFPNLTVTVANVRVCNKAPFEGTCLANIGSLTTTIDIKSLFGDRIDIRKVGLERPTIVAKVLEDGRANWDIALPDTAAPETPEDTAASAFNVGLREYWITDGHVIYDDASLAMVLDLAGLDHTGSGDFTQDLFTLRTTTHCDSTNVVYEGVKYLKNAKADIKADLDMDLPHMKFTFKENEATVNRLVLGMDGWLAMPTDDIVMDLTWSTRKNDLATLLSLVPAEFAGSLDGVDMSGKAEFSGYVKGTYNDNTLPGFGVRIGVDNGRFKYPDLPESVEGIVVDCDIRSPEGKDLDGMVVDLKRFAMKLAGNPIDARMHLTTPISDPDVDADLRAQLDLASLRKVVPMEKGDELKGSFTADVRMKGRMSAIEKQQYDKFTAEGKLILLDMAYKSDSLPYGVGINSMYFDFSPRYLQLTSYEGTVGGSDLKANGRFDNYLAWWLQDSTLAGTFNVSSTLFDLNELMGPEDAAATTEATADTTPMSVIEVPRNIDFRLSADMKQVRYDDMDLRNCKGGLHVHDRRVDLDGLFFNLFNGAVTLSGAYVTTDPKAPTIDFSYDVKDLDIEQTVKYVETVQKMAPIAKTCKGSFSTNLKHMTATLGPDMMPLMNTLAGQGTLHTHNVRVDGFQPLVDLAKALKVKGIENTTLQNVDFSYEFKDGKMWTKPFDVKIDQVQANVGGSTAFADQAIDYDMKTKIPTKLFGNAANELVSGWLGQANKALGADFKVPEQIDATVKMTGTITKPVIKPVFAGGGSNLQQTVTETIKTELNEQINKGKEQAIAEARAQADKLVAEAQKQADDLKAKARQEAANLKAQAYKAADDALAQVKDPFGKLAAKAVADKAKKEADKKEQQAIAEADKRADALVTKARAEGDALIRKAEETNTTVK